MTCQWEAFIKILPLWLQKPVDRLGKGTLTELRLRTGQPPQLIQCSRSLWLENVISGDDITFCINAASQYSPWSVTSTSQGYITAAGGHRIGICGEVIISNGLCTGFRHVTSLCIRIARDIPNIAGKLADLHGSLLIIGPPGCGKTTLLRDLIRQKSRKIPGSIAVLDERGEIFPSTHGKLYFDAGPNTDILAGISKSEGIEIIIRCMGPRIIAVDEVTASADATALANACRCGVEILATAHAYDKTDLYHRRVYQPLVESGLFANLVILRPDKSWRLERMES